VDVADAYVSAFPRDRIIGDYERLLSGVTSSRSHELATA
jgi:hypothetical protein